MGKFDENSYSNSSGLNGVGLSCINALSTKLEIYIVRKNQKYNSQFQKGILTKKLKLIDKNVEKESGTTIKFYPDLEIFDIKEMSFDFEELSNYFRRLSFLNPKLKFILKDKDNDKIYKFYSKNGISDYLNYLVKNHKLIKNDLYFEGTDEKNNSVKITLNYSDDDEEIIMAFCNSVWNSDGGTHVQGFKFGLVMAFKNFISEQNLIPKKADITIEDINGDDIREGLVAVIDLKHKKPLYASQTKLQLTNRDTQGFIMKFINDSLSQWLVSNLTEGKKLAQKIIDNAISRKLVKIVKDKNKKSSILKSNKLSDCIGNDKEKNELWIVEGKLMLSLNLVNCWKTLRIL